MVSDILLIQIFTPIIIILIILITGYFYIRSNLEYFENSAKEYIISAIDEKLIDGDINVLIDDAIKTNLSDEKIDEYIDKYLTDEKIHALMLKYTGCENISCIVSQQIAKALGGNPDPKFCDRESAAGNKCFKNCVLWPYTDNTSTMDKFCVDDFGISYKYSGNRSQGHCTIGQGIASCKPREDIQASIESKLLKNCVLENQLRNKSEADKFCQNDFGPEWISDALSSAGCFPGITAKAYCIKTR